MPVYRRIMNIPISRGRPRLMTAFTNASINVASGTPGGDVRWSFGRSSFSTGFVASRSRFTSHTQQLESVDCRTRMVLNARSCLAMDAIQARTRAGVRSSTVAGRPSAI
jgi:hypothetical protein